jgi:hypothetical protein
LPVKPLSPGFREIGRALVLDFSAQTVVVDREDLFAGGRCDVAPAGPGVFLRHAPLDLGDQLQLLAPLFFERRDFSSRCLPLFRWLQRQNFLLLLLQ